MPLTRKIVQIAVIPESDSLHCSLVALADDGTTWIGRARDMFEGNPNANLWRPLPPLPPNDNTAPY
jgi:hypothetical protein